MKLHDRNTLRLLILLFSLQRTLDMEAYLCSSTSNVMANKNNLVFLDDLSLRFSIFYFHLTKIQKTLLLYMWYGDGKPQQFSCCYYFPINSNIKKYKRQEVTLKLCTSVPQGFVRYLQLTANAALACVNWRWRIQLKTDTRYCDTKTDKQFKS